MARVWKGTEGTSSTFFIQNFFHLHLSTDRRTLNNDGDVDYDGGDSTVGCHVSMLLQVLFEYFCGHTCD